MNRISFQNAAGILAVLVFLALVAAMPQAGATVVNDVSRLQEFYNDDDLNGTTTVALQYPARRWMIHNASTSTAVVYTPATATGDASAGVTIPAGASLSDACSVNSGQDFVQSFRLWSSATVEIQILAGRDH